MAVLKASGSFCLAIVLFSAKQEGRQSTSGEGFAVHGDSAVTARGPHPRAPLCRPSNGICEMCIQLLFRCMWMSSRSKRKLN